MHQNKAYDHWNFEPNSILPNDGTWTFVSAFQLVVFICLLLLFFFGSVLSFSLFSLANCLLFLSASWNCFAENYLILHIAGHSPFLFDRLLHDREMNTLRLCGTTARYISKMQCHELVCMQKKSEREEREKKNNTNGRYSRGERVNICRGVIASLLYLFCIVIRIRHWLLISFSTIWEFNLRFSLIFLLAFFSVFFCFIFIRCFVFILFWIGIQAFNATNVIFITYNSLIF